MIFVPSRRSSRAHVPMTSIDRSNASASLAAAISCSARRRSCELQVALDRGEQEAALELAGAVEVQHRRARRQPLGATRAGQRRPHVLLAVVEELDRDAPQLTLEDLVPPLFVRRDRDDAPLDAHPPAAAAAHGPDDDRAAAVDVAVEQRVQRHDGVVVLGAGWTKSTTTPASLPGCRRVTRPTRCW